MWGWEGKVRLREMDGGLEKAIVGHAAGFFEGTDAEFWRFFFELLWIGGGTQPRSRTKADVLTSARGRQKSRRRLARECASLIFFAIAAGRSLSRFLDYRGLGEK